MRILLAGDSCLDVFVAGRCERLSPERPVPIFIPLSSGSNAGMAGNVLANIQSLSNGAAQVTTLFPESTITKTRYVDKGSNQHLLRVDDEAKVQPLSVDLFTGTLATGHYDAVVISDYAKGFLNTGNMALMLAECARLGVPTFIDTKCILGPWSEMATVVKINAKEYAAQLAANVSEPWTQCRNLIVTQGGDGMVLFADDGTDEYRTQCPEIQVHDVVGAGDTVIAGLVVGYLETNDLTKAMDFAEKAASLAVSKRGVVAVRREEIT